MKRETKIQRSRRQAFEKKVFVSVLRAAGNTVVEEYRFDKKRRWRFDIAIPRCEIVLYQSAATTVGSVQPIAIEIEGLFGRHQTIGGFTKDLSKYSEAFAQGWNVLRVSWAMIADGTALDVLARAGVRVTKPPKGGS